MEDRRIVLVTGGNRGIGHAIGGSLATRLHNSVILLTCRDLEVGYQAIRSLPQNGSNAVEPLQLDVSSDDSIRQAMSTICDRYGQLDVLINNAGFAAIPSQPDSSDLRSIYQNIFNVNVSSVALLTTLALPLLRRSRAGGKVIQIGSARGSITRLANGDLPPTVSVGYSISKTALHALTLQMAIDPDNSAVEFQIASPGHCKTAFNGYKGARDPSEGANVVVELVVSHRRPTKCWETHGTSRELIEVPW